MIKKCRPILLTGLAAFLVLALALGGCGKKQGQTQTPGADFTADRLPGVGSVYVYNTNLPLPADSEGLAVSFALEGSWNFSSGPTEVNQHASFLAPAGLPGADRFPESNLCLKSENSGEAAFLYYLQDSFTRKLLGSYMIAADGSETWDKYDPPKVILRFPMELYQPAFEATTVYSTSEGFSEQIDYKVNVRWIDTVTVPAGVFPNTVMMQYFDIHGTGQETYNALYYSWYAPDVGQVAFVHSFLNEAQPAFNRAVDFRRLVSYQLP
jgi:hypothetical protein